MGDSSNLVGKYIDQNNQSRARLRGLTAELNEKSLNRVAYRGWTVAMTLAHMAFFDNYRLAQLQRWEQTGFDEVKADTKTINSALRPLLECVNGKAAIRCVVSAANSVDQQIENLSQALVNEIGKNGRAPVIFDRARHRNEHLDEIDQSLIRRENIVYE